MSELLMVLVVSWVAVSVTMGTVLFGGWIFSDEWLDTTFREMVIIMLYVAVWPVTIPVVLGHLAIKDGWRCTRWYKLRQKG